MQDEVENRAAEWEAEHGQTADKNKLFEEISLHQLKRKPACRMARIFESEQLRQARQEVAEVRAALEASKAEYAQRMLDMSNTILNLNRDVEAMKQHMHVNGGFIDADETEGSG